MKPSRQADSGVTLLELLISLTILAMMSVAIASMLGTGTRVWEKAGRLELLAEEGLTRNKLRSTLEEMPVPDAFTSGADLFAGDQEGVRFLIPGDLIGLDAEQKFKATLSAVPDGKGKHLRLTYSSESEIVEDRRFAQGATSITFSYYGHKARRDEDAWHEEWSDLRLLPDLVKVEVTLASGAPYPPITIQPAKINRHNRISLSSLVPPD